MADRPWVTPQEVRDYTEIQSVKDRADEKLAVDISRAELYVINYTRNRFDDPLAYPQIPEQIRTAVILLSEQYAAGASELGSGKSGGNYKSETFDEYSYTVADTAFKIGELNLGPLLDAFVNGVGDGDVVLRMRKL